MPFSASNPGICAFTTGTRLPWPTTTAYPKQENGLTKSAAGKSAMPRLKIATPVNEKIKRCSESILPEWLVLRPSGQPTRISPALLILILTPQPSLVKHHPPNLTTPPVNSSPPPSARSSSNNSPPSPKPANTLSKTQKNTNRKKR